MGATIAFKPYAKFNHTLGVATDSIATDSMSGYALPDSLIIQQSAAIVIQPAVTDSLASQVAQKQKQASYWKEQDALADEEIQKYRDRVRAKQKQVQKLGQSMMQLDDVERLLVAQNADGAVKTVHKPRDKTGRIDPATGLKEEDSGEHRRPN